nr:membrane protein insertase YidC [Actinomycetes bacterium]
MNDERRNLVFAIALSMAVLITWQLLVEAPPEDSAVSIEQTENAPSPDPTALPQPQSGTSASPAASPSNIDVTPQIGTQPVAPTEVPSVLASASRVPIRTPRLMGHFDRVGLRIDDLLLRDYRETVDPTSQPIRLFHPQTSFQPYYAEFG